MYAHPALVRPHFASVFDRPVAVWIARLGTRKAALAARFNDSIYSDELRRLIGVVPLEDKLRRRELFPLLKTRAHELGQKPSPRKSVLDRNIDLLVDLLGLDAAQAEILAFAALSQQHYLLSDALENLRVTSMDEVTKVLAIALDSSESAIRIALRPEGELLSTRIVRIVSDDVRYGYGVRIPDGLRHALFGTASNLARLMSAFVEQAPRPKLKADAFIHLQAETALLCAYLGKAKQHATPGINILIYGPPGTGKTEYVRWLAAHLQIRLFQVKATDAEGDAVSGYDRLAFFQLSQRFLQRSPALILFDEIEDVFPSEDGKGRMQHSLRPTAGKLFVNQLLETNPVPTIWVANEVGHIDPAYLRRFDFSFEMGVPPVTVRRGILQAYLHGHAISEQCLNDLAQQESLSPAQVEKAAKVLALVGKTATDREATLRLVIDNGMALLGQTPNHDYLRLSECHYALDYLNPDCDIPALVAQLKRAPQSVGAMCFYGAPGTGKTALAHFIAREIGIPLIARRASDILSPYVGETEQKIAGMFKQAQQAGALLLLDEADSFLAERQSARNTWEVTGVNEMLTQMERFDGLFICSTNLMQRLDAASLRRFALKIKFDYLKPEQRWQLFRAQFKRLSSRHEAEHRAALNQLNTLTPGDFATVRRQAALFNITLTADEWLQRLTQECRNKAGGVKQPIGFVHTH